MSLNRKLFLYRPKGLLRVSGPDSGEFLQGQFSNDLSGEAGLCSYGYWLNRKGKILADSFVLKESEESFLVFSYECSSDQIFERLDAFIIMDEVEIDVLDTASAACSIWGLDEIGSIEVFRPAINRFFAGDGFVCFRGVRGGGEMFEVLSLGKNASAVIEQFEKRADIGEYQIMDTSDVDRLAIRSDRPLPPKAITSSDLPQETSMEADTIAYNKGCYLGQEVMARIKSMGRVRRRLIPVNWVGEKLPDVSSHKLNNLSGKQVGELRMVVRDDSCSIGFAILKSGSEIETCRIEGFSGSLSILQQ